MQDQALTTIDAEDRYLFEAPYDTLVPVLKGDAIVHKMRNSEITTADEADCLHNCGLHEEHELELEEDAQTAITETTHELVTLVVLLALSELNTKHSDNVYRDEEHVFHDI